MAKQVENPKGLELAFCSAWDGWDGDYSSLTFYDITPTASVTADILTKLPSYKKGDYLVDLTIHNEISKATISVYNHCESDALFELSYNITLNATLEQD